MPAHPHRPKYCSARADAHPLPTPPPPFQVFHNVINNKLTSTPTARHGVDPSTELDLPEVPVSTRADVDRAVDAATASFPAWSALSQEERADYLMRFADALEANQPEFIELLGREAGKPLSAASYEVGVAVGSIRGVAALRLEEETMEDTDQVCTSFLCLFLLQ